MKYKLNGQWVDVTIKPLDSMPVGSQVEFTGSTIPAGWQEVNDYSLDEVNTGKKWIDGRPIYRKVLRYNNVRVATGFSVNHNISNIKFITDMKTIFDNNGNLTYFYAMANSDGYLTFQANSTSITAYGTTYWGEGANRYWYFILEYTKTTD